MGRFFSNIHIKKDDQQTKEEFIVQLNNVMSEHGFVPATEDDGTSMYYIAFSESKRWVTVSSDNFESDQESVRSDTKLFAKGLKAPCFSTTVVDSDFTILEMYNATSTLSDTVIVGDGSGYGFKKSPETNGKRELWEPLLCNNSTWKQLSDVWNKDSTFTESALAEMALLIGLDENHITMDYEEFESNEEDDTDITMLYFKKAVKNNPNITVLHPPVKYPTTLNAAFKQIFGEALEPLGYKRIKGKQPYLVRIVNDEIFHVITISNRWCGDPRLKAFAISGGVGTVYRKGIDLNKSTGFNGRWLTSNWNIYSYSMKDMPDYDDNFRRSIYDFQYKKNDNTSMIEELKYSLEITQKYMLAFMNKAVSLEACIDFLRKFNLPVSTNSYDLESFFKEGIGDDEGALYIKTNYQHMKERWRRILDGTQEAPESTREAIANMIIFFDDPVIHEKALAEIERRKKVNTEILRSYGLDI